MAWRDYRDLLRQMDFDMERFTEEALMSFLDHPMAMSRFWQPPADVHETSAGIVIKLEIAGVTVQDVQVALSGDGRMLTVSGVRSEQRDERGERTGCHQLEIYFGPFERSFAIPPDMEPDRDAIQATLKDGFLTIVLPRREPAPAATRQIPIEVITD
ncbi:MAG: Hsp20/alpha crystallin family protein [Capsulimonadales bacterium]|nr:Hsp20/alpha crystallin family protein [Capsulimonadales bacterium]